MGHAVFVFGAAGSGKSTFCKNMKENGKPNCNIRLINLDPAQENGDEYDLNLCDFITVNEVMEELDFGPNGALFYALNEMIENIDELNLQDFENDYFFFDCPGQIELFLHSNILQECVKNIKNTSKVAIVYLFDGSVFLDNSNKLLYSMLCATISMSRFYLPVINVISKADLIDDDKLEEILDGDLFAEKDNKLGKTIEEYVSNNGMTSFIPLDYNKEEMVQNVFMELDNVLQRYDDIDPKDMAYE